MGVVTRRYAGGRWGQVHCRESAVDAGAVPLVCLHATAYSSRSFMPLMQALGDARPVIAIDLPGYGESDAPPARPAIADYADAVAEVLGDGPHDLFGYHTGVTVAVELALRHPAKVRQLTLMGVPFFRALDFEMWRTRLATPHQLGAELAQFDERWGYLVTARPEGLSLAKGFANFVDELKAWPNGSWAHQAMFAWDADARLPQLVCPVTILNPDGHLAVASRAAAGLIPQSKVIELPELTGAVLDLHAETIAAFIPSAA